MSDQPEPDDPPRHVHDDSCWERVLVHDEPLHDHDFGCWETRKLCPYRADY